MLSVGIDLEEIARVKQSMRNPGFCRRILGEEEYRQLAAREFPPQSVAASFCAKEAFSKVLGTGVRNFSLKEVELLRRENGAPYLHLHGRALTLFESLGGRELAVSVSHTRELVTVVVVSCD